MDFSAVMLNDPSRKLYNYTKQLPYLNTAIAEFREEMLSNNIPATNATSASITIPLNTMGIGGDNEPPLPPNLVEIASIWEQQEGDHNNFIPVTRQQRLPLYWEKVNELVYWAWEGQRVKFLGATTVREIKLEYVANVIPDADNENSLIGIINSKLTLSYRTAALCARFIGENPTRADSLDTMAGMAMERFLNINIKSSQAIWTRRRPFRANWKTRGIVI